MKSVGHISLKAATKHLCFLIFITTFSNNHIYAQCATPISTFPYIENFDVTNGNWTTYGQTQHTTTDDWTWGSPSKPFISAAGSGTKCWILGGLTVNNNSFAGHTSGNSFYNYYERSFVQSPCFNFTNLKRPFISFLVQWESEYKYDGTDLQYSTDGGVTWNLLGLKTDPVDCYNANWYNYTGVRYMDSLDVATKDAWCGNSQATAGNCQGGHGSGGWVLAKHCLSYLAGKPTVQFRFGFGAGFTCNDFDGFAFDSISIGEAPKHSASINYTCTTNRAVSFTATTDACASYYGWNFGDPTSGANNTSTGAVTASHTFSGPGTYTVSFIDTGGCGTPDTVTQTLHILDVNTTVINPGCTSPTGKAIANVNAGGATGITYSWNTTPVQTTDTATNLNSGSYIVTINAPNSCSTSATAILANVTGLNVNTPTTTPAACGSNNGTANVTYTGGTAPITFTWSTVPAQTTATASNLTAGTYSVTVKDANGCSAIATATVTSTGGVTANITNHTNTTCGNPNGSATVSGNGGTTPYTYNWSSTPAQTTATAINLASGNYTVTVGDAHNCSATATVIIGASTSITATISGTTPTTCNNSIGAATVSVSGGTNPINYSWGTVPIQTTANATGLAAGNYTVTVKDGNNCTSTAIAIITQPGGTSATITASKNESCFGYSDGSATVTASGGTNPYSYAWGVFPAQTTATATNLAPGNYSVTVKDANNCAYTVSVLITEPPLLKDSVTSKKNISCFGQKDGSASVIGFGGTLPFNLSWNTTPVQTGNTVNGLAAGNYTVLITDGNGCTASTNVNIKQPSPLTDTIIVINSTCAANNGKVWSVASGGSVPYAYNWNTSPAQTTDTITGLGAGSYTAIVTDANNCTASASGTVIKPTGVIASITSNTNVSCYGGNNGATSASGNGGTLPYTYIWNTIPAMTTNSINNLIAGIYTITITDASGCTSTATDTITSPPKLSYAASNINISCHGANDGSVHINTDTLKYSFNGSAFTTDTVYKHLAGGNYTIIAENATGCKDTAVVSVVDPAVITLSIIPDSSFINRGDQVNLLANTNGGTSPYTYLWSPNSGLSCTDCNNPVASPFDSTIYKLILTDMNGCTDSALAIVYVRLPLIINYPNAFSPNGDGVNDIFRPITNNVPTDYYLFRVFDRWGEMLFETTNIKDGWDGTYKGDAAPLAAYVWYAEYRATGTTIIKKQKGNVTLVR